jgi:hypothetical protein
MNQKLNLLVLRQFSDLSFIAENIRKMAGALPWVSRWALRSSSSLNLPGLSTPGKPVRIIPVLGKVTFESNDY